MRILTLVVMLGACATDLAAQEQTLLKPEGERGGFGGAVVKFTSVNGQAAILIGGRGGWILDHPLAIGGGAYTVVNEIDAPKDALPLEGPLDIEFGYLGFELEYALRPASLTHYSLYTFVGAGITNFVKDVGSVFQSNEQVGETAFMFLLEPAANAELNVARWLRLNAGVSYRIVVGVSQEGLRNKDFTGLTASLTFKSGKFYRTLAIIAGARSNPIGDSGKRAGKIIHDKTFVFDMGENYRLNWSASQHRISGVRAEALHTTDRSRYSLHEGQ